MQRTMNSRGFAAVVGAVLVMVVSMTLAILVGTLFVKGIGLSLSPAISCTRLQIDSPVEIQNACYDSQAQQIKVSLSRKFDSQDLVSFSLSLTGSQNSKWSCSQSCGSCELLDSGATKEYKIPTTDFNAQETNTLGLFVNDCALSSTQIAIC